MSLALGIRCKICGETYPLSDVYSCPRCSTDECSSRNNTLEVTYDYGKISRKIRPSGIEQRTNSMWRFVELLPVCDTHNIVTLGEGATWLKRCRKLEKHFRVKHIFVKDESTNPTGCHKDREASVLISKAREWRRRTVSAFTCGNLGSSVACYSAKAGLDCVIFIPYLNIHPLPRIAQMIAFGARLYQVVGTEKEIDTLARVLHDKHRWVFTMLGGGSKWEGKPQSPYIHEGKKTIAFEVAMQMGWKYPDHMFSPGSGGNFYDCWRGFKQLKDLGWVKGRLPRMHSVESTEANPTYRAFMQKKDSVILERPGETVTYPISSTVSPLKSLMALRESGGSPLCVTDKEVLQAQKLLAAKEGIFVEPASATSIAGLAKLAGDYVDKDETVVCTLTATGLKFPEPILAHFKLPRLRASIRSIENLHLI